MRVVKVWRLVMKESVEARIIKVTERLTSGDRYSAAAAGSASDAGASGSAVAAAGNTSKRHKSASWEQHARQHDSTIQAAGSLTNDRAQAMKLEELEILFKGNKA